MLKELLQSSSTEIPEPLNVLKAKEKELKERLDFIKELSSSNQLDSEQQTNLSIVLKEMDGDYRAMLKERKEQLQNKLDEIQKYIDHLDDQVSYYVRKYFLEFHTEHKGFL